MKYLFYTKKLSWFNIYNRTVHVYIYFLLRCVRIVLRATTKATSCRFGRSYNTAAWYVNGRCNESFGGNVRGWLRAMNTEQYILWRRVLKEGLDCPRAQAREWRYRGVYGAHPAARVGLHPLCFVLLICTLYNGQKYATWHHTFPQLCCLRSKKINMLLIRVRSVMLLKMPSYAEMFSSIMDIWMCA